MSPADLGAPGGGSPVPPDQPPTHQRRWALARLAAVLAIGVALAVFLNGVPVLVVVLALVAMVMIHELGHFVTAKLSGMKVTEYFLGFGPRLWSVRKGETEYGVKALPAGGYVRIVGMTMLEEVDPADEDRSFRQASFPRRLLVAVAGSAMHFVMAFLLLWGLVAFAGLPVAATPVITSLNSFTSGQSPAEKAGFHLGDEILAIDGHRFADGAGYIAYVQSHPDRNLAVLVSRDGRQLTLHVRPANEQDVSVLVDGKVVRPSVAKPTGVIGVSLDFLTRNETSNPFVALQRAGTLLGSITSQTATGIVQVFSLHGLSSFAHQVATAGSGTTGSSVAGGSGSSGTVSGTSGSGSGGGQFLSILGAIQLGAQAARRSPSELLYILVAVNIFVGMINLFPMLPLDGGHVLIAVYERVRSRRGRRYHADVAKLMPVAYVFLLFMVVLGVGALYANIVQPVTLPGG